MRPSAIILAVQISFSLKNFLKGLSVSECEWCCIFFYSNLTSRKTIIKRWVKQCFVMKRCINHIFVRFPFSTLQHRSLSCFTASHMLHYKSACTLLFWLLISLHLKIFVFDFNLFIAVSRISIFHHKKVCIFPFGRVSELKQHNMILINLLYCKWPDQKIIRFTYLHILIME